MILSIIVMIMFITAKVPKAALRDATARRHGLVARVPCRVGITKRKLLIIVTILLTIVVACAPCRVCTALRARWPMANQNATRRSIQYLEKTTVDKNVTLKYAIRLGKIMKGLHKLAHAFLGAVVVQHERVDRRDRHSLLDVVAHTELYTYVYIYIYM